jgi:hypothetical protein
MAERALGFARCCLIGLTKFLGIRPSVSLFGSGYCRLPAALSNTLTTRGRSKLPAMNPSDANFTESSERRCAALSERLFVPSGQLRWQINGRYRRRREYPQPPPPTRSNTRITISIVSIVSPLFGLSILHCAGALTNRVAGMNPSDSNFTESSRALVGPFRPVSCQVGDFAGKSMAAGATGANENIPSLHHPSKTTPE